MPKAVPPLTDTKIRSAKAKCKEYNLADGAGLQLRIKPNGNKHWLFNYIKPNTNKRKNISLGQYPLVSIANARKKRDDARALLAKDIVQSRVTNKGACGA
ncbi:Arm DNA-binding domain-containing protein [Thalassotalea ganghwensis]